MCCFVIAVVVAAMHTIRLLDVVTMRFLPFTYATALLLLPFVRQLLAQMATTRERTYSVCSVSQSEGKNVRKKNFEEGKDAQDENERWSILSFPSPSNAVSTYSERLSAEI